MSATKNQARLTLSLLLALALLPVFPKPQLPVGLQYTGEKKETVLLDTGISCSEVYLFTFDKRPHFNGLDGLFSNAEIPERNRFDGIWKSSGCLTEDRARFIHRAERRAIPIRASPCR